MPVVGVYAEVDAFGVEVEHGGEVAGEVGDGFAHGGAFRLGVVESVAEGGFCVDCPPAGFVGEVEVG